MAKVISGGERKMSRGELKRGILKAHFARLGRNIIPQVPQIPQKERNSEQMKNCQLIELKAKINHEDAIIYGSDTFGPIGLIIDQSEDGFKSFFSNKKGVTFTFDNVSDAKFSITSRSNRIVKALRQTAEGTVYELTDEKLKEDAFILLRKAREGKIFIA